MPANRTSFAVTDAYRERLQQFHRTIEASTRLLWGRIPTQQPDLDAEYERFLAGIVPAVTAAQTEAVRTSNAYLTAYLTAELGEFTPAETGDGDYIGSRDGRTLREALHSPLVGVLAALKQGQSLDTALRAGLTRALRMLSLDLDHAARTSLQDALIADERVEGYHRALSGTCGACLGAASGTFSPGIRFPVHPGCECVTEPVVAGVLDRFPRPTGPELFAAMSAAEQDAAVGQRAAEAIRTGALSLTDLVGTSPQRTAEDFITQAPTPAP